MKQGKAKKEPKVKALDPQKVDENPEVEKTEVQSIEEPETSSEPKTLTYDEAYAQVRALKNTSALNMFWSLRRRMSDEDAVNEVLRKMGISP